MAGKNGEGTGHGSPPRDPEKSLEADDLFLQDILDSIQDGVSILDKDLNIVIVNNSMKVWYARNAPIEGKKCYVCYQDRDKPCDPCPSLKAMRTGRVEQNIVSGHKGSSVEFIELFSFPIRNRETGEIIGVVEFVRDVTEKKRLELQLIRAQKMEAVGTMAGGVAHDFNNLLMGIQGNVSLMLLDINETHAHYGFLKSIEDYVKSAADLSSHLLGFARGGKYEVLPSDMNKLLNEISWMFGRTKKEISIEKKLEPSLRTVEIDRRQMENVVLNILINAWQAMPGGGTLYLQTGNVRLDEDYVFPHEVSPGDYVKISITDTGTGMAEKVRHRVFDPFFTTKEMGRGTGLGLASAYGIVKNHGGIITVYSEVGEGTTFNIYLPASDRDVVEAKQYTAEIMSGCGTILLVDDEEVMIQVGKPMLEKLGYRVNIARSGREAIEIYEMKHGEIDIVILDMIMPVMKGSAVFDRIREIDPEARVLLASGYSINGQARAILERGCNGFIQKPFNLGELSQKLKEILNS